MMATLLADIVSWALLVAGGLFVLAGGVGLIRLPDVYTRMHAAGIGDTLGMGLILAGLAVQAGFTLVTAKLVLIFLFMFFTSPTASHALAKTALSAGVEPMLGDRFGSRKPPD